MVNEITVWNTGAHYTKDGQRIAAVWDGTYIHYMDRDRMCDGSVRASNVRDTYDLKQKTMLAYDNGLGRRSIKDGYYGETAQNLTKALDEYINAAEA